MTPLTTGHNYTFADLLRRSFDERFMLSVKVSVTEPGFGSILCKMVVNLVSRMLQYSRQASCGFPKSAIFYCSTCMLDDCGLTLRSRPACTRVRHVPMFGMSLAGEVCRERRMVHCKLCKRLCAFLTSCLRAFDSTLRLPRCRSSLCVLGREGPQTQSWTVVLQSYAMVSRQRLQPSATYGPSSFPRWSSVPCPLRSTLHGRRLPGSG